jgi:hypothetical protein
MVGFTLELFVRAWHAAVSAMGTTTLAVAILSLVVPVVLFLYQWSREGFTRHGWQRMVENRRGDLLFFAATLTAWMLLFGYQLFIGVPRMIRQTANNTQAPSGFHVSPPVFWDTKTPRPVQQPFIKITRYQRSEYVAGAALNISLYFRYVGGLDPIDIRGYANVDVAVWEQGKMPSRGDMAKLEDELWKKMEDGITTPARPLITAPEEPTFVTVQGPPLTPEQADDLQKGRGVVFFMGEMRYTDYLDQQASKKYCGFFQLDPEVFFSCDRHNN